jgi:phage antirepressor YoqD-like protein
MFVFTKIKCISHVRNNYGRNNTGKAKKKKTAILEVQQILIYRPKVTYADNGV